MKTDQRSRAEEFGRRAEFWAKCFLLLKGFRTINERFKARGGEIDLIVKRSKTLVFVEVKARRNRAMLAEAFEGVRQDRIINAARYFLSQNPQYSDYTIRFDVIGLAPSNWPVHIVDAFQTN